MRTLAVKHRLQWAIGLTFFVLLAEAVGGWLANSLALLSDAAHMFTDVISLSLSWLALHLAGQPSSETKTYGYHRMEIFAALINGLLLFTMAAVILWEAGLRALAPEPVHSPTMIAVAGIGLVTNLGVLYFLKDPAQDQHHRDLNLKAALFHVLGDTLASVAVIAGGVVILNTGWFWMDSAIAAVVALVLMWGAKSLVADSVHILLEGVPRGISLQDVERELNAIPDVEHVHELHIWCICSNIYALSTHARIREDNLHRSESILTEIQNRLAEKFNITHSTVQLESVPCGVSQLTCDMKH